MDAEGRNCKKRCNDGDHARRRGARIPFHHEGTKTHSAAEPQPREQPKNGFTTEARRTRRRAVSPRAGPERNTTNLLKKRRNCGISTKGMQRRLTTESKENTEEVTEKDEDVLTAD